MIWKVLLVILIGGLATWGGSPLVQLVFRLADRTERKAIDPGPAGFTPTPAAAEQPQPVGAIEAASSQLRGGLWIGYLERIAIFATILAGYGAGLLVILGVKGLARYPELTTHEKPGAAERFIIGTFASALTAAAGAGLALWLTSLW